MRHQILCALNWGRDIAIASVFLRCEQVGEKVRNEIDPDDNTVIPPWKVYIGVFQGAMSQ